MNPSLLLIPDRYKASKLYSQIPDSGAGDLAFTRANDTATRVNSEGLIEKVRTNIALYSEQFENAAWTANQATVSANATTSPIGTTTADKVIPTAVLSFHNVTNSPILSDGVSYSLSVFAKADGYNFVAVGNGFGIRQSLFNLASGVVTSVTSDTTASIVSVGNGWFRCSIAFVATNPTNQLQITVDDGSGAQFVGDGTSGVFLWGAQAETGDIATDYIPTTTAAVSVGPVANIPRIDYTGGGCGRLLLEPQRANLLTFSEQFDNAAWSKTNVTITANNAISPDGFINADTIVDAATNAEHAINAVATITTSVPSTLSVFLKKGTQPFAMLRHYGNATEKYFCVVVDLNTGTITKTQAGTDTTATASSITNYGNGWYRVTATASFASTTAVPVLHLVNSATPTINSAGGSSYSGTGTNSVFAYGFQLENASAYPTSYIPTLGASVTRSADAASKTGISSLIGQTEGTIYWEGKIDGFAAAFNEALPISLFATGADINGAQAYIALLSNMSIRFVVYDGTTTQCSIATSSAFYTFGTTIKMAAVYKANDFALYINGVQIGTDTSGSVLALSQLSLDYQNNVGKQSVNTAAIYTSRLSNSELASLTTL